MSGGPSRLFFVPPWSRFLEKCALIIKLVDVWTRHRLRHVWKHVSNVHGIWTLILTETGWLVCARWESPVSRASACVMGTMWEMRAVKVGPFISCRPLRHSDASKGLYLCVFLHFIDFFKFIASSQEISTKNMIFGHWSVGPFFFLKSLQEKKKKKKKNMMREKRNFIMDQSYYTENCFFFFFLS